jgi:hypothetical protein
MKIMLDNIPTDQQGRGLRIAQAYVGEYMNDGRGHGPRHCVIFTNASEPDIAVWHSKAGQVTVRQTGG